MSLDLFLEQKIKTLDLIKSEIYYSITLMRSYVEGVEKQANQSIEIYEKEKREIINEVDDNQMSCFSVEEYQGLTDTDWQMEHIFKEYFPSIQRSSALVTIFSFFEVELNKLCEIYKRTQSLNISFKDLSGNGVQRATNYLDKIINLNMHKDSEIWQEITKIQKLRNIIVHSNGKLINDDGGYKKDQHDYVKKHTMLDGDEEIIILEGYLDHVLDSLHSYLHLIDKKS